jgi:hypothetical protein
LHKIQPKTYLRYHLNEKMNKTQSYESYSFLEFIPTPENP